VAQIFKQEFCLLIKGLLDVWRSVLKRFDEPLGVVEFYRERLAFFALARSFILPLSDAIKSSAVSNGP
jgi:hypothetical protein